MRFAIFFLVLMLLPFVMATSISDWDSFGGDDCFFDSCGSEKDDIIWVGGRSSFEIVNTPSHTDVVCVDMDADGESDSCVYKNLGVLSDCLSAYPDVNNVAGDSLFDCDGSFVLCGWGFYNDNPSFNLNGDFIVCSGGEGTCTDVEDAIDSDFVIEDELFEFSQYRDCDDSEGLKDFDYGFDNQEISVMDKKGAVCDGVVAGTVDGYNRVGDWQLWKNDVSSCSFIEPSFEVEIGYCDADLEFNTTVRNEDLDYQSICKNNFTIIDDLRNALFRPCNDGVITDGTNETFIDYGGLCGNCSVNISTPENDLPWVIGRELYVEENGRITWDNAFNSSICEVAEPIATTPVIFILLILLFAFIFFVVIVAVLLLFIAVVISGVSRIIIEKSVKSVKRFIKDRNK